ncbi:MAG: aminotransferase class I/II-fold pyridoxal phosphate-dependent enzyme [Candidatus Omnitrophica bacterium]|nr:aminotransferase class I/II-fold pyridoxal phosphate-dependent enzyme [Candidatus Omnitrophota bacterium]
MSMKISKLVEQIPPSGIRVFFELVLGMKDVISLGVGEPDFVTPWNIRERAIYSLEEGYTSYTSNKGMVELRREISRYLKRKHGLDYDPEEEILVTVGVSEGFDLAVRAITDRGDKILIQEPAYVSYGPVSTICGGKPVPIKTFPEDDFKVTSRQILKSCDRKTKAMVLSYPNNPTGNSYSKKELKAIAGAVVRKNLIVISDEIYCDLTYDFEHTAFATLPGMRARTIYLNGFSKAFAMTGWRIGYACGPKEIIAAMTKIHQYTMMCVPITSQMAAMEALRNGEKSVQEMKREYRRRREFVIARLNEMGLSCHKPEGAFYAFPSIKKFGLSSLEFSSRLLKEEKVAVVPGTAFGSCGEGYVRISYATGFDKLKEAMNRMERFLQNVTNAPPSAR